MNRIRQFLFCCTLLILTITSIDSFAQCGTTYTVTFSTVPSGTWNDEGSWQIRNVSGTIVASGVAPGCSACSSTGTYVASGTAPNNGPFTFWYETQGTFNDNVVSWSVSDPFSGVLVSGTAAGGTALTSSAAFCGGPLSACSGTPTGGTTTSTANPACPGVNFTLGTTGSTVGVSGLTYQWQSSPDGTSWSPIFGATSSTLTTSEAVATYYRLGITCSGSTGYSSGLLVNTSLSACYCTPATSSNACIYMWISNITTTGGVSNITNATGCAPTSYTNYSASSSVTQYAGSSVTVNFSSGGYPLAYSVFVDLNNDGDFADAGELIASNANGSGLMSGLSSSFLVPPGTTVGDHRMRIRGEYYVFGAPVDPCSTLTYGETEDYTLTVAVAAACSGAPPATTATTTVTPVCPSTSFSLSVTGLTPGVTGYTYQWQSSPAGAGTFTNIFGATSNPYTTTQSSSTDYKVIITCTASGLSTTSAPVSVVSSSFSACYCTTGATQTADEEIYSVTVNGATNALGCGVTAPGPGSIAYRYSNFSTLGALTSMTLTSTIPFTVSENECDGATYYAFGTAIWIDYNHDGVFNDATEKVFVESATAAGPRNVVGSFTVPGSALTGITGMRITCAEGYSGTGLTSCLSYGYGETEDYLVNIMALPAPACAVINTPPSPVDGSTGVSAALLSWNAVTYATGYDVYFGTSPTPPLVSSNQPGTTYDASPGLATSTTYYWQIVPRNSTGPATGCTIYSFTTAASFTPPSCTTNLTPADAATFIPVGTALTWNVAPNATSYDVYWGTSPTPPLVASSVVGTTFTPTYSGTPPLTYYWYVVPKNAAGPATGCSANKTSYTTAPIFCTPVNNGDCSQQIITAFSITSTTLNNPSACPGGTKYTAYPASGSTTATLAAGTGYTFNISSGSNGNPAQAGLWIDYNHSGTLDASEFTLISSSFPSPGSTSLFINIPASAMGGYTLMRVRSNWASSPAITGADACSTLDYGETEDYTINITAAVACSGAPTGGTTTSTLNPVCPGINFTLGTTGTTTASGLTYQWQSSPDGSTWSNISGATSSTYTTSESVTTYFRLNVTCTASGVTSPSSTLTETLSSPSSCYCTPVYTSYDGTDYIANVTLNTINNTTGSTPNPGYNNYSGTISTTLLTGSTHTISVTSGSWPDNFGAWIDFNQNGTFEASEKLGDAPGLTGGAVASWTFTVPGGAVLGNTRLRVACMTGYSPTIPCPTTGYGEAEDYGITINSPVTCSGTPAAATASAASTSVCSGNSAVLSVATASSTEGGIAYQWYSSATSGGPYTAVTTGSGGATANYTSGALSSDIYYVAVVKCTATGDSVFSNEVAITIPSLTITGTTPGSRCGVGTVVIGAASAASVYWWDAATGGSLLGTGSPFTTPSISSTTTFYAEPAVVGASGNVGMTSSAQLYYTFSGEYLTFDAYSTVLINSVEVYPFAFSPSSSGSATISLTDNVGTVLQSITIPVTSYGLPVPAVVVPLNFVVPPGSGYRLLSTHTGFEGFLEDLTASYPYTLPGVMAITGSSSGAATYLNFYNWNVSSICQGPRSAVTATVNTAPAVSANASPATLCNGGSSTLTASSSNPDYTYTWDMGAGSGASVSVSPTTSTTYTVTANDVSGGSFDGCAAVATVSVGVVDTLAISSITATPSTICAGSNSALSVVTGQAYCIPSGYCGFPDIITNVTLSAINYSGGCDDLGGGGYSNFPTSTATTTLAAGSSYSISVSTGGDVEGAMAWIDWNQDGVFANSEIVLPGALAGTNPATYTASVAVPVSAVNGATRMRVRCVYFTDPSTLTDPPCEGVTYGETEDYTVTVTGGLNIIYNWSPSTFLSDPTVSNPTATAATTTTTYTATVSLGGCPSTASVDLNVNPSGTWLGLSDDWGDGANWCGGVPTASSDVIIPATGSTPFDPIVLGSSVANVHDITLQNSSVIVQAGATMNLYGDITLSPSGTFDASGGTTNLAGSAAQSILPGFTTANLMVNGGSDKTLSSDVTVSTMLSLTSGNLVLGSNDLILPPGASIAGGSASSFVRTTLPGSELVQQVGATPVTFPVGNANFNPVTMDNTGTMDNFRIHVRDEVLVAGTTGMQVDNTTTYVINHTFDIEEDVLGGSLSNITIQWGAGEENTGLFQYNHAYIAHFYDNDGAGPNPAEWHHDDIPYASMAPAAGGYPGPGPYSATTNNVTTFSPFAIGSNGGSAPLHVQLTDVSAVNEGAKNKVEWHSAVEDGLDHYEVERSTDGQNFSHMADVAAAGHAFGYLTYDNSPNPGLTYYRLKLVEQDGSSSYSQIVHAFMKVGNEVAVAVYPNPVSDVLHVEVFGSTDDATVTLTDLSGKVIAPITLHNGQAEINMSSLSSGVYFVKFSGTGVSQSIKVNKQ